MTLRLLRNVWLELVLLGSYFKNAASYTCPSSCGTPASLAFCGHIEWASCKTADTWNEADSNAKMAMQAFLQEHNLTFLEIDGNNSTANIAASAVSSQHEIAKNNGSEMQIRRRRLPDVLVTSNRRRWLPEPTSRAGRAFASNSSVCFHTLQRLHCAAHFPVCEIGTETQKLCEDECESSILSTCAEVISATMLDGVEKICSKLLLEDEAYTPSGQGNASVNLQQFRGKEERCFRLNYAGSSMTMWVAGFLISLIFSILATLGINLQKYSLTKYDALHANSKVSGVTVIETVRPVPPFRQPLWLLGFTLILSGSILDFIAFGLAPQTLLAPLAALSLVWNMILAPLFHREKVTRQNIVATIVIFLGVTITVVYAGHATPNYELDDLIMLYEQPIMYVYIICVSAFIVGLFVTARSIENRLPHLQGGFVHIICYGGLGGTFGGQSVLLAKSTVELVKSVWFGTSKDAFTRVPTYIIIAAMATTLLLQITFLNEGLRKFDALLMVPVYQSFWILASVLGGIMYFEEYTTMTYTQTIMFPIGGVITLMGIIILLQDRITPVPNASTAKVVTKYAELTQFPPTTDGVWDADESDDEETTQRHLDSRLHDNELLNGTRPLTPRATETSLERM